MPNDDDILSPEAEASSNEEERAEAEAFAKLVDDLVAGKPTPPALTPSDRDLLEVATMVRASNQDVELAADRRASLIERAFSDALQVASPEEGKESAPPEVIPIGRRRLRAAAPWLAATIAAAAAVVIALTRPTPTTHTVIVERPKLSAMHRSRPADTLIGKIDPADSGRASERLDIIFADRLAGYRDLELRGLNAKRGNRR